MSASATLTGVRARSLRSVVRAFCATIAVTAGSLVACGGDAEEPTFLKELDLNPPGSSEIRLEPESTLVLLADFTDPTAVRDVATIQRFFEQTPYNSRSFLETYSSNGVSAAGAVLAAAVKYSINPIVLLVRLQMAQGLIGLDTYPDPYTRTEYVFQCGCDGQGTCVPEMAGLDRQLECLAARLRSYLQQINDSPEQLTYGGWGKDQPALTLDGVTVTPPDESTAALYQLDPVYGENSKRGAWLFYRIYALYIRALGYSNSIDPETSGAWIGEACTQASDCSSAIPNVRCLTDQPGGYCTAPCADDGCPSNARKASAICADLLSQGGGCVAACNPAAPNCRDGYVCAKIKLFGTEQEVDACTKP